MYIQLTFRPITRFRFVACYLKRLGQFTNPWTDLEVQEAPDHACQLSRSWYFMYHPHSPSSYVFLSRPQTSCLTCIGSQISQTASMLTTEYGTASNIKSRVNRSVIIPLSPHQSLTAGYPSCPPSLRLNRNWSCSTEFLIMDFVFSSVLSWTTRVRRRSCLLRSSLLSLSTRMFIFSRRGMCPNG
jgi:hypothetical protein